MYLFGLLFLAQETTQNFLSVLKSLLWCRKRKRLWDLFGPKGLWCPLLLQLRAWVRLLVTLWYVSCLALIQSGTKDLVLQATTYGTDYFLSYKGIFITSKRGNETRGEKTLKRECGWSFPQRRRGRRESCVALTTATHKITLIKPAVQTDTP